MDCSKKIGGRGGIIKIEGEGRDPALGPQSGDCRTEPFWDPGADVDVDDGTTGENGTVAPEG